MHRYGLATLAISALLAGCVVPPADPTPLPELGEPVLLPSRITTYASPASAPVEKPVKRRGKPPRPVVASRVAIATVKAAANSRFAKISVGMSRRQVENLIGLPGDVRTLRAPAAKAASNPGDAAVLVEETFYRQEGSLVFGKGGTVLTRINVNSAASGIQ